MILRFGSKLFSCFVLSTILIFSFQLPSFGISQSDLKYIYTPFYDPDFSGAICEITTPTTLPSTIPAEYAQPFQFAANQYSINPIHIAVIHTVEQRGNEFKLPVPTVWPSSSSGAQGPMQFVPIAWQDYAQDGNNDGDINIQNLYDAGFAAANKLSDDGLTLDSQPGTATGPLVEGTFSYVMAAYNAGPGTARQASSVEDLPSETREYIRLGLEALERLSGGSTASNTGTTQASTQCGSLGVGEELTFPLYTTREIILNGSANSNGDTAVWCYESSRNCHGAGTPEEYNAADIFAVEGTVVVAAVGGVVESVFSNTEYSSARIKANNGLWYFYQHMSPGSLRVSKGQQIVAGAEIGIVGDEVSAFNTAPHLHFDVATSRVGISRECVREGRCNDEKSQMIDAQPALIDAFSRLE